MGAAFTLATMGLLWRLLAPLRGAGYASIALLAVLCMTYYNGRLNYYNHNIVLMVLSTASAALCWQAFATRRLRWWFALGVVLGLGALTKYQIAVTMASVLVFFIHARGWRDPGASSGRSAVLPGGAADVCAAHRMASNSRFRADRLRHRVFARRAHRRMGPPHGDRAPGLPISSSTGRSRAWLLLIAAALWARRAGRQTPPTAVAPAGFKANDRAKGLLLAWGVVPLLFMPLVALLSGADLQLQWGTPFLLFAVPAAMELLPGYEWNPDRPAPRAAGIPYLSSPIAHGSISSRHPADRLDCATVTGARSIPPRWPPTLRGRRTALSGGPIRIVGGDAAIAGTLALQLPEQPLVLIDGRLDRSPWVSRDLLQRCGALLLA